METVKEKQKRRFAVILPIIVLPFIMVIFWVLGGGTQKNSDRKDNAGVILQLPTSQQNGEQIDKLKAYDLAETDSSKSESFRGSQMMNYDQGFGGHYDQSDQIYQRLDYINRELENSRYSNGSSPERVFDDPGTDRLEAMMRSIGSSSEPDPELEQLDGMLEKIAAIQNPGLEFEKQRQRSLEKRGTIYPVIKDQNDGVVSSLEDHNGGGSDFLSTDIDQEIIGHNAIRAIVHAKQVLVSGSNVKFRLMEDVFVNGVRIPKDHLLTGKVSITDDRLAVKIENVAYNGSLFPVQLTVYDPDGIEGIHIPGAIGRDVAKQSADRTMQGIGLGYDPSWGTQAANAGIEVVKSFIGRRTKLVKVIVKAGYQVLLKDEKQK